MNKNIGFVDTFFLIEHGISTLFWHTFLWSKQGNVRTRKFVRKQHICKKNVWNCIIYTFLRQFGRFSHLIGRYSSQTGHHSTNLMLLKSERLPNWNELLAGKTIMLWPSKWSIYFWGCVYCTKWIFYVGPSVLWRACIGPTFVHIILLLLEFK